MKLISVKCPNCGSKLEFTPNSKTVTCEYCGYDIMVDDEVKRIKLDDAEQTGYDLGKGLHRALQEAGEEAEAAEPESSEGGAGETAAETDTAEEAPASENDESKED